MATEDNDVVTPAEFAELRTTVGNIKESVSQLQTQSSQQNNLLVQMGNAIERLTTIKDMLEHKLNNTDSGEMWALIHKTKSDVDSAHQGLRNHKDGFRNAIIILIFCFGIIQGAFYWYATGFVSRTDKDHDILMRTVTHLEQLSEDYYYEKRRNFQGPYQSSGNSGEDVSEELSKYLFPQGILSYHRTTLVRQRTES